MLPIKMLSKATKIKNKKKNYAGRLYLTLYTYKKAKENE